MYVMNCRTANIRRDASNAPEHLNWWDCRVTRTQLLKVLMVSIVVVITYYIYYDYVCVCRRPIVWAVCMTYYSPTFAHTRSDWDAMNDANDVRANDSNMKLYACAHCVQMVFEFSGNVIAGGECENEKKLASVVFNVMLWMLMRKYIRTPLNINTYWLLLAAVDCCLTLYRVCRSCLQQILLDSPPTPRRPFLHTLFQHCSEPLDARRRRKILFVVFSRTTKY